MEAHDNFNQTPAIVEDESLGNLLYNDGNLTRFEQVKIIAEHFLGIAKATDITKAVSSVKIYESYKKYREEHHDSPEINKNTFQIYLSKISTEPESKINCEGKKKGYYLDDLVPTLDETLGIEDGESDSKDDKGDDQGFLEKDLYPILEEWLLENDYERVKDISQKKGSKWSNPDVLGIKTEILFGNVESELTTIEAKQTAKDWKQWIFQAVAHTLFANRSYFAFSHSEAHINKIDKDLKHYAENFGIGILIIALSKEDFKKIANNKPFKLNDDNYSVIEYVPAQYKKPHLRYKSKFLSEIGISDLKSLYNFGKSVEG